MTPDELLPSPELLSVVKSERERVEALVVELRREYDGLLDDLRAVEEKLAAATARHKQLGHVLGEDDEGQTLLWTPEPREVLARRATRKEDDGRLRGSAIRIAAVRAALATDDPARPRHYREWLQLVEGAGDRIDGQDPGATLLTQLSRCPLIIRGVEPGTYQLDPSAIERLRDKREALRSEAATQLHTAAEREYDAIDLAQALAAVEAEVRRTDRAIAEAEELADTLGAREFFSEPLQPAHVQPRRHADTDGAPRVTRAMLAGTS